MSRMMDSMLTLLPQPLSADDAERLPFVHLKRNNR